MIKSKLVKIISKKLFDIPEHRLNECVKYLIELMITQLMKEGRIEIRGFGSFTLHHRTERVARNPKTGLFVKLPAHYILRFKPSRELKQPRA